MEKLKAFLKRKDIVLSGRRYGIDALGAMAQGLFASLLIGTIIATIGEQIGIALFVTIGGYAKAVTGEAMAVAIGYSLHCPPLVLFSLAAVGHAANTLGGAGGPLAVLLITIVSAEFGKAVSKETKVDILVTPLVTILVGSLLATVCACNRKCRKRSGTCYYVGYRVTAIFDGNDYICHSGDCIDASYQQRSNMCGAWSYRACRRGGTCRMLCTDDRFCSHEFSGKWDWRIFCAGYRHFYVTNGEYCEEATHLASSNYCFTYYRTNCDLRIPSSNEWSSSCVWYGDLRSCRSDWCLYRLA